jgi:hypothetical protein
MPPFFSQQIKKGETQMKVLEMLGIYGWKPETENLLLASLLTGDPVLLVGRHGCAKTHVACKLAEALGKNFVAYDASKTLFDDVLGYPDIEKMKQGRIEYLPSKVTVWDKEMILVDELNRAIPEMQAKYLELIRSRKIMGFPTRVRWVLSAMNPVSYSGTQQLDEALIGRFATFVYPPDVLEMEEADRIRVTSQINGDDCPAIEEWLSSEGACLSIKTISEEQTQETGSLIERILTAGARHFFQLRDAMPTLAEFLSRFADLLMKETKGEISLDGRRLGFIHRNILANRAVELAKAEALPPNNGEEPLPSFSQSARHVLQHSIPVGLNDESVNREEAFHKMEICFDLLSAYFDENAEMTKVEIIYELFTTKNLMRKAEILLKEDLGELAESKAWNDMMASGENISLLAYTALQVEARRPGTIPKEIIEALSKKIDPLKLTTRSVDKLKGESVEYIEEVEKLLERESDLARLVAHDRVARLVEDRVTPDSIAQADEEIERDIEIFEELMSRK